MMRQEVDGGGGSSGQCPVWLPRAEGGGVVTSLPGSAQGRQNPEATLGVAFLSRMEALPAPPSESLPGYSPLFGGHDHTVLLSSFPHGKSFSFTLLVSCPGESDPLLPHSCPSDHFLHPSSLTWTPRESSLPAWATVSQKYDLQGFLSLLQSQVVSWPLLVWGLFGLGLNSWDRPPTGAVPQGELGSTASPRRAGL